MKGAMDVGQREFSLMENKIIIKKTTPLST